MGDTRWLSLEEAYARRNEYPEEYRSRIVEMMRMERVHRVKMRQLDDKYRREHELLSRSWIACFLAWLPRISKTPRRGGK